MLLIGASDIITELNGYDVLLGRSVPKWKCTGNGIFRRLIAKHGDEYRSLNKHVFKDEIARRILLTIRVLGGRFLRQIELSSVRERLDIDSDTEAWVAVDEETSLQKIKQALRDQPCNSKSQSASTSTLKKETASKLLVNEEPMSLEGMVQNHYAPNFPFSERFYKRGVGNVARFPFPSRSPTKLDNVFARRKNEFTRVHNLTIATQLRLLKQHQGQRLDRRIPRQSYQSRGRGNAALPVVGKSPKFTASIGNLKNIYVR